MNESCEFPKSNPTTAEIAEILKSSKTIAVVGLSDKSGRDSYRVASYLQSQGYKIIPVNPNATEILGERSYPSLREIPVAIDVVDIFRKPDTVPEIVAEAISINAKAIWMQEGIVHNASAALARSEGLRVVMSKCMLKEHKRMLQQDL